MLPLPRTGLRSSMKAYFPATYHPVWCWSLRKELPCWDLSLAGQWARSGRSRTLPSQGPRGVVGWEHVCLENFLTWPEAEVRRLSSLRSASRTLRRGGSMRSGPFWRLVDARITIASRQRMRLYIAWGLFDIASGLVQSIVNGWELRRSSYRNSR